MSKAIPSTSAVRVRHGRFDVFDVDAKPIHVGDHLEWQETAGPYGQTRIGRGVVSSASLLYGCVRVGSGSGPFTHLEGRSEDGPEGLYCRHENHDPEHAHKTWARVVRRFDEPEEQPCRDTK